MARLTFVIIASLLLASSAFADQQGGKIQWTETDGTPAPEPCWQQTVSNGTLTNSGGDCTLTTGGGGGDSITVNATAATDANFLDNIYIDWTLATAPTPDDVTAKLDYTQTLAGNPAFLAGEVALTTSGTTGGVLFEGAADAIEGLLQWAPTTSHRTLTLPDTTDTLVARDTTDTLTNKSIVATQLTGTLAAAQFPALTGDVTTVAGALATTIATDAIDSALNLATTLCTANQVLKKNAGNTAWACAADADSGGAPAWSALTAPTAAVSMVSDATAETATFDFQAAFTTGNQFIIQQTTGNPTGGTLLGVLAADADVSPIMKLENTAAVTIATGLQIAATNASGVLTTAIDASDAEIGTALAIGANTLTVTDGALLNLQPITVNTTTEGLQLPIYNAGGTAQGQISWNGTVLYIGDATAARPVGYIWLGATDSTSRTSSLGLFGATGWGGGSENSVAAFAMICDQLYFQVDTLPGAGNGWTPTFQINGVSGSLTCATANALSCSDTTNNSGAIAVADLLSVNMAANGTPTGSNGQSWMVRCKLQ